MEDVFDDDIERIIAEDLAAFETDEKEQEVAVAEKVWGEEKARRRKGFLGVPAADARIGGNYTDEEIVRTRIERGFRNQGMKRILRRAGVGSVRLPILGKMMKQIGNGLITMGRIPLSSSTESRNGKSRLSSMQNL